MIYVDSSVVLAEVLSENRRPSASFWNEHLVSSRMLRVESWTRVHRARLDHGVGEALAGFLARIDTVELTADAVERALHPFPVAVRALDALHLAAVDALARPGGWSPRIATYDLRLQRAARALRFQVVEP